MSPRARRRKYLLGALASFALIQFLPISPESEPVELPVEFQAIEGILRSTCLDCHSTATQRPYYRRIAPFSWWVTYQVYRARDRLDLSDWSAYTPSEQLHWIRQMSEEIEASRMPPESYLFFHRSLRLTPKERTRLQKWAASQEPRAGKPIPTESQRTR